MKSALLLPLLVSSSASLAIEPRQTPPPPPKEISVTEGLPTLFGGAGVLAKPVKIEQVKPRVRGSATRQYIRYGPFKLPASKDGGAGPAGHGHGGKGENAAMDPNGFPFTRALDGGYCTDCTILAGKMDVVLVNGSRADIADGVYLHHVVTMVKGKTLPKWVSSCPVAPGEKAKPDGPPPPGPPMSMFIGGAVDEFTDYWTSKDGNINSGYYIAPNSTIMMSGEMINYLKTEQEVYVRMDLEYLSGKHGAEVVKSPLSVDGCDTTSASFNKPGMKSGMIKSKDYLVEKSGTIVLQRAHMHDGGTGIIAYLNDKKVCDSQAEYGSSGTQLTVNGKKWQTINKVSECTDMIKVKAGDRIRLEGGYDYEKHPLRESNGEKQENMGFMSITWVEA